MPTITTDVDVVYLAFALLDEHGLHDWNFDWDRGVRRAGCCHHRGKLITLSHHYVSRNLDKPDDIRDTILHEIAHALVGPHKGHGSEWKDACVRIGAKPTRCYGDHINMPEGKYVATCKGCGNVFRRHKQPRQGGRYCLKCGPDTGRLTFVIA